MAACAYCKSTVLFGGRKLEGLIFCNDTCLSNGQVLLVSKEIPDNMVAAHARRVHDSACPVCNENRGPVEVHTAYKVTSFLIITSWSSRPCISCTSCGRKHQFGAVLHSLLLGWWGFPWGLLMTPVQIVRNVSGMLRGGHTAEPSERLQHMIRLGLAANAATRAAE